MTALPASSDFTGSTITEGQFKTAITNLRDFLSGLLGADGVNATALAALGALGSGYDAKTAAYTVVTGDRGRVLNCSGTWTLSLPAAAAAGAGFCFAVRVGSGTITIDPSGAELIDGSATFALVGGRSALLISTGTEWLQLAMPRAQNSATDNTADRLMAVGAFGLGGGLPIITDLTVGLAPGLYGFAENTAIGSPGTTAISACLLVSRVGPTGNVGFIAWRATTGVPKIWFGGRPGATDAITWAELWTKQTALGTVSQAAGVPTGAIIERGTNANGEYVRFADGTQIYTQTLTASAAAGMSWTYPAAFTVAPVVVGTSQATVLSCVMRDAAASVTACTISARDKTDARRADTVTLTATGRWF